MDPTTIRDAISCGTCDGIVAVPIQCCINGHIVCHACMDPTGCHKCTSNTFHTLPMLGRALEASDQLLLCRIPNCDAQLRYTELVEHYHVVHGKPRTNQTLPARS